jgi:hypothetical protein
MAQSLGNELVARARLRPPQACGARIIVAELAKGQPQAWPVRQGAPLERYLKAPPVHLRQADRRRALQPTSG